MQDKNIAARIKQIRHRFTQVANIPSFEITILTISSKAIENNGAIKIESSRQNRIMRESAKPGTSKRSKRNSEEIKKGIHIKIYQPSNAYVRRHVFMIRVNEKDSLAYRI